MGIAKAFNKVKLFSGVIYRSEQVYDEAKKKLEELFSSVDLEVGPFDFDFTTYYNREMGSPLYRRFISFEKLISPEELPDIKILTDRMEMETAINENRVINLDPGYLSEANVIIATTKNYYQRVPLSKGIYAHIEYVIKKKKLWTLEWTYPDFKTPQYMDFFERLNRLFKQSTGHTSDITSHTPHGTGQSSHGTGHSSDDTGQSSHGTSHSSDDTSQSPHGTGHSSNGTSQSSDGTSHTSRGTDQSSDGTSQSSHGTCHTPHGTGHTSHGTDQSSHGNCHSSNDTSHSPHGTGHATGRTGQ